MHTLIRTLTGTAAAAALSVALLVGTTEPARAQTQGAAATTAQAAAPAEKKPKDQGEYDLYNGVIKDVAAKDGQKALADLNTWTQKYPQSDYKDDRLLYFQSAYGLAGQPDKVVDYGAQIMAKDVNVLFKDNKLQALTVYYQTAVAITQVKSPAPELLAAGEKASRLLLSFVTSPANKPATMSDADWTALRGQTEPVAKAALMYVVGYPGDQLMAKGKADPKDSDQQKADYAAAEQAYRAAYQANPDMGLLSYDLGSSIVSQKKPETYPVGLFFIARADALDPAKGGLDEKMRPSVDTYLKNAYTNFHGSDDGLDALKQLAAASPNPPADFKIETSTEIDLRKQKEFAEKNPELARWLGIKAALAAPDGEQFFASSLKDAQVPTLKGQVMGGKPECNPKELQIAIPEPDQKSTVVPVITLKLEAAIKGKPVTGSDISFSAQASAFTKEPVFMLTMDVDKDKIPEVKVDACTATKAAPKGPAKAAPGGAAKKAPAKK